MADPRLENVNTVMIGEVSPWECAAHSNSSGGRSSLNGTSSLPMEYAGQCACINPMYVV